MQARDVVRREAGQSSGVDGSSIDESNQLSIVIHERTGCCLRSSLKNKFQSLDDAAVWKKEETRPRIQRVPFMLRENQKFEKYYEPRVVAIGPIHHGKPQFAYAEKLKLRLAGCFITENKLVKEVLWNNIANQLEKLKKFYDEDVIKDYTDEDLTWIILVDGCAMLQFMRCIVDDKEKTTKKMSNLNIKSDQAAFAQQDMFLLENQLPYACLELLMQSISEDSMKVFEHSIKEFVRMNMMITPAKATEVKKQPCHLLDLLRENLIVEAPPNKYKESCISKLLKIFKLSFKDKRAGETWPPSFRHVSELKASGVTLRRSSTCSLRGIYFRQIFWGRGILELPLLIVDDSTGPKLMNLIALEMCPDFINEFEVSSYIYFLDSLIDQTADVKELRTKHILHNVLGSDDEVATLFNEIGTNLVENPDLYGSVKQQIGEHYENRISTWMAQFFHDHFSSPWTVLAFIGVLLGLGSSFIQTWSSLPEKK